MEDLLEFVAFCDQINQKEAEMRSLLAKVDLFKIELGIEILKAEIDELKLKKDDMAIAGASLLSEVGKVEVEGIKFKVEKGRESVQMKEGVDLASLPPELVTIALSPNKNAIKKVAKKDPELVSNFAEIVVGPDKLSYSVV